MSTLIERCGNLEKEIQAISEEIFEARNKKNVMKVVGEKFVPFHDEEAVSRLKERKAKLCVEQAIIKFCLFKIDEDTVYIAKDAYIKILKKKLKKMMGECTVKKNGKWVVNEDEIDRFKAYISSEESDIYTELKHAKASRWKELAKRHPFIIAFSFLLGLPIASAVSVITPSPLHVPINNDWIGYLGSYFGTVIGSGIGGFIAYRIATYQFDLHNNNILEERKFNYEKDFLTDFVRVLLRIKRDFSLEQAYLKNIQNLRKGSTIADDINAIALLKAALGRIRENKDTIFEDLDEIERNFAMGKAILGDKSYYYKNIHMEILNLIKSTSTFEDLYQSLEDSTDIIERLKTPGLIDREKELMSKYADIDYNLYTIITMITNTLNQKLGIPTIMIKEYSAYIKQQGETVSAI